MGRKDEKRKGERKTALTPFPFVRAHIYEFYAYFLFDTLRTLQSFYLTTFTGKEPVA